MFIIVKLLKEIDDEVINGFVGGSGIEFGEFRCHLGEKVWDGVPFAHSVVGDVDTFLGSLADLGTGEMGDGEQKSQKGESVDAHLLSLIYLLLIWIFVFKLRNK
jgi:hypothetical protein